MTDKLDTPPATGHQELLPCPFCHSPAELDEDTCKDDDWYAHCTNADCPMNGLYFRDTEWNKRAAPSETAAIPYVDRGDAVNLAHEIRETDNIEAVTRRGILSLVDAVLRMDEALKGATPSATRRSDWIAVSERKPEATAGPDGEPPFLSDDVLALFPGGECRYDIVNYDHEVDRWSLVAQGFDEADTAPTHWMPLPEAPSA